MATPQANRTHQRQVLIMTREKRQSAQPNCWELEKITNCSPCFRTAPARKSVLRSHQVSLRATQLQRLHPRTPSVRTVE